MLVYRPGQATGRDHECAISVVISLPGRSVARLDAPSRRGKPWSINKERVEAAERGSGRGVC